MSSPPGKLYFAYGSNLWLQQMASRCPNSEYVGRGILPDHIWQINERGFANVVQCSGYKVHGLVFRVGEADEKVLDRKEGVRSGAYSKAYKSLVLYPALQKLQLPTRLLAESGDLAQTVDAVRFEMRAREQKPHIESNALVYLSETFIRGDSDARDEYIDRINAGIKDALALGVPADFIESAIRPSIPDRTIKTLPGGSRQRHNHELGDSELPRKPGDTASGRPQPIAEYLAAVGFNPGHCSAQSAPDEPRSRRQHRRG